MRVMLARWVAAQDVGQTLEDDIRKFLEENGFRVQPLHLPAVDPDLRSIAAYRLLPVAASADALLCLDVYSAILKHSRKLVWLTGGIEGIRPESDTSFTTNVLRAGVREASALFVSNARGMKLDACGLKRAKHMDLQALPTKREGKSQGVPKSPWAPLLRALKR